MRRRRSTARRYSAGAVGVLLAMAAWPTTAIVTDPTSTLDGAQSATGDRAITYVATLDDVSDLAALGIGGDGFWFARFDAAQPITTAPTSDGARDALPAWVGAFNHTEHPADPGCGETDAIARGCLPSYNFRTFSQDGPARSAGGFAGWATLRLPDRSCGRAGAIVDPKTFSADQAYPDPTGLLFPADDQPQPTNNNTINRIQLQDGVPATFFVGVVTDATAFDFEPGAVEIRGNVGLIDQREEVADSQVESDGRPSAADLDPNGRPDVHVFRVDHFTSGDYLKLRLRGTDRPAAFTGLVFATELPDPRAARGEPPAHRAIHCERGA